MRNSFHRELKLLDEAVFDLTGRVGYAIDRASVGLLHADLRAAESVVSGDEVIDQIYKDVELRAMRLIARQQPVARDLRELVATVRMVAEIERMGDLALHIAKIARRQYPAIALPEQALRPITEMAEIATAFAARCAVAVAERDGAAATDLDRDDDRIDELHRQLFAVVLSPGWTHPIGRAIDVTLCGRYYERFCDHVVTVAAEVAYIVTGSRG